MTLKVKPEIKDKVVNILVSHGVLGKVYIFGEPNNKNKPLRISLDSTANTNGLMGNISMLEALEQAFPDREVSTTDLYAISQPDAPQRYKNLYLQVLQGELVYER